MLKKITAQVGLSLPLAAFYSFCFALFTALP